jgi:hypothetical protein
VKNATAGCIIGRVLFVDGVTRDVYEDAEGRQWVAGYAGERVYGVWLKPADDGSAPVPPSDSPCPRPSL